MPTDIPNNPASPHVQTSTEAVRGMSRIETSAIDISTTTSSPSTSSLPLVQSSTATASFSDQTTLGPPVNSIQLVFSTPSPSASPARSASQDEFSTFSSPATIAVMIIGILLGLLGAAIMILLWSVHKRRKYDFNPRGGGFDETANSFTDQYSRIARHGSHGHIKSSLSTGSRTPPRFSSFSYNRAAHPHLDDLRKSSYPPDFHSQLHSFDEKRRREPTIEDQHRMSNDTCMVDPLMMQTLRIPPKPIANERLSTLIRQAYRCHDSIDLHENTVEVKRPALRPTIAQANGPSSVYPSLHTPSYPVNPATIDEPAVEPSPALSKTKSSRKKQINPPERLSGLIRQAHQYERTANELVPVTMITLADSKSKSRSLARSQSGASRVSVSSIFSFTHRSFDVVAVPSRSNHKPSLMTLKSTLRDISRSSTPWRISTDTFAIDPLMMQNFPKPPLPSQYPPSDLSDLNRVPSVKLEQPRPIVLKSESSGLIQRTSSPFQNFDLSESIGGHPELNEKRQGRFLKKGQESPDKLA